MPARGSLTPKQQRFVDAYLISLNATQAYLDAGYHGSANVAAVEAHKLLRNPKIIAALQTRQARLQASTQVTQERVLHELALVAFADMACYVTWGRQGVRLKDAADLPPEQSRVVAEVSETTTQSGGTLRFKLHDKIAALTKLGDHLGIFQTRLPIDWEHLSPEQIRRLAQGEAPQKVLAYVNGHAH